MRLENAKPKHRKGLWSPDEDEKLRDYVLQHGHGSWSSVPGVIGLQRNGKSCRLRWINYLRPGLKRGTFSKSEEELILSSHRDLGNKWSRIAQKLPGRTDNEIKNHWHTHMKKRTLTKVPATESQELGSMYTNSTSSFSSPEYYSSSNGSSNGIHKEGVRGLMPKVIFEEWLLCSNKKLNSPFDDDHGSCTFMDDEVLYSLDEGSLEFESAGEGWPRLSQGVVSFPDCLRICHGSSGECSDLGSASDHGVCSDGFDQFYTNAFSSNFES